MINAFESINVIGNSRPICSQHFVLNSASERTEKLNFVRFPCTVSTRTTFLFVSTKPFLTQLKLFFVNSILLSLIRFCGNGNL